MIRNYLITGFRQLMRNKFYSLINILGLAIALASCLLIIIFVQDELSYDKFHTKKDRIFRIVEEFRTGEGTITTALTPYRIALDLKDKFPEIERVVRIDQGIKSDEVEYGNKRILQTGETAVDPDFFDVFSFELLQGDSKTALIEPNTVVIADEIADVYFPNKDAMGKVLKFVNPYHHKPFSAKVTGVFRKMPKNSHFQKDILLSAKTADNLIKGREENLGLTTHYSYLLLYPDVDPKKFEKAINEYILSHYPKEQTRWWASFQLQKLTDIHLRSHLKDELEANSDIVYIYIFSAIAFIIVLLAGINYMNLATARAASRAKEIGVRKVVGALKWQLIYQLIGESVLITFMAVIISFLLSFLLLPLFNNFTGKELEINLFSPSLLFIFFSLSLIVGFAAGTYPAFFLSAYNPSKVLKGSVSKGGYPTLMLRKVLVVLQFSISIMLLIGTFIIYNQWNYLQNKKLGIHTDGIIIVPIDTEKEQQGFKAFKEELLNLPDIEKVTATDKEVTSPFGSFSSFTTGGKKITAPITIVETDFFKTFDVPFLLGSDFTIRAETDSTVDIILNESAVKLFGQSDPIGKEVIWGDQIKARIIGVVKDFHLESLHSKISPIAFVSLNTGFSYAAIKTKTTNLKNTMGKVEEIFERIDPEATFKYYFLNAKIADLYRVEAKFFSIFTTFSGLAIFIACIGIFGLASFTAYQRTKEIGIRKVMGASVKSISFNLTSDFIKLVLIANLVAWPLGYVVMEKWLENFAHRIEINIWVFLLSALVSLIIAISTVGFQAIKAAIANPVKSLRSE